MRILPIICLLFITGCVSENQSPSFSDEFDQQEAAKTRISLGLTYLKNGNYSQAKQNLDKALAFAPRLADSHYGLAYYYQIVGEVTRADESFQIAISLAPRDADIANSYGAFLCQQGKYDDAKTFFLQAVNAKQYANSAQTYENMALCAQSQGQGDDAIEYLNSALKHQPGRAKTLFILTEMYVATEQFDLAKHTLRRYEKVARVSPDSLWMAIEIAKGQRDLLSANLYGEMLLRLYPNNPLTKLYIKRQETVSQPVIKVKNKPLKDIEPEIPKGAAKQSMSASIDEIEPLNTQTESPQRANVAIKHTETTPDNTSTESTSAPEEAAAKFHIVKPKENLYRLSLKYNIKLKSLKDWNDLDESGAIRVGAKLWLVPPAEQTK